MTPFSVSVHSPLPHQRLFGVKTVKLMLPLIIIALVSFVDFAEGQTCSAIIPPRNKCSCSYSDGTGTPTLVDFEPLSKKNGQPAFAYKENGDYKYAYNPCFPFSDSYCTNVAACQVSHDGQFHFDIGDPGEPAFSTDGNDIVITYQGSDARQSIVNFHCDPNALNAPTYAVDGEVPIGSGTFKFVIGTCLACVPQPANCHGSSGGGGGGGGLTVGGVLCIVFTVLVVVYIIGGIVFQKFARGATGKEMIPNYGFWSDFPVLIKDGCMHLVGLCRGGSTDYESMK